MKTTKNLEINLTTGKSNKEEIQTQELPLSDKDVQLIQDVLQQAQKTLYEIISTNTYTLTAEIKDRMMLRANEIGLINLKLNR